MLAFLLFTGSFSLTIPLSFYSVFLFQRYGYLKTNYAGRTIPGSMGILFIPLFTAVYLLSFDFVKDDITGEYRILPLALLILIAGMAFVGFMDDVIGDRGERGFRGHISALFHGKITTGLFKAAAGMLVSIGVSYLIGGGFREIATNAFLIALCANLYNLLDLRPGRAIKCFIPVLGWLIIINWNSNYVFSSYLLSIGGISIAMLFGDLREIFMLGDAGSNVLGGVIGLGVAVWAPMWLKLIILGVVLILNLLSEVVSFSRIIDSVRVLKWIDGLGRKGLLEK